MVSFTLSGGKHQRLMLTQILGVNGPFGAAMGYFDITNHCELFNEMFLFYN